jgi:hypothetical protein
MWSSTQTFALLKVLKRRLWPFFDILHPTRWQVKFKICQKKASRKLSSLRMYVVFLFILTLLHHLTLALLQIASVTPNTITHLMSDFEVSDYAFTGDIQQVNPLILIPFILTNHTVQLIPFDGDLDMQNNPYINITGNVTKFDIDNRTFTMTPMQYISLTHTTSPFPIHAHFVDSESKKRWGAEGLKVAVGSTITIGGFLQRVVRQHTIDRPLEFAQVEVTNVAYLATRSNLSTSPTRMSPSFLRQ